MAVGHTTYISLAKPDDTELAKDWTNGPAHGVSNRGIIQNAINIVLTSYSPELHANIAGPGLGAGSAQGQYQNFNGFIIGSFSMKFADPGIVVGSGEYGFQLPFPADPSFHTVGSSFGDSSGALSCIGEGYICDNSAVATSGSVALDVITVLGVGYARMWTEAFTSPTKTSKNFRDAMPFTVADSDCLNGHFIYKKA